jgi:hypothetical protein
VQKSWKGKLNFPCEQRFEKNGEISPSVFLNIQTIKRHTGNGNL